MVDLARCVLQRGSDVFGLKIRHFGKEFFGAESFGQQIQHIRDPDAHAPYAGASAALSGIYGNPLEQVGHDVYSSGPDIPVDNEFIVAQHHPDVDSINQSQSIGRSLGTARPAAASASAAAEPRPTRPLESHLNALPRAPLMPFDATGRMAAAIPFAFDDYLERVDATGRVIREDKRGYIPGETPRILERLNIDPEQFIATAARMLDLFSTAIGTPEHLTAHCVARNVAFLRGMGAARALFERKAA